MEPNPLDSVCLLFDAVCPDLTGQLFLIPFIGPFLSANAGVVCSVDSSVLGLSNEALLALSVP